MKLLPRPRSFEPREGAVAIPSPASLLVRGGDGDSRVASELRERLRTDHGRDLRTADEGDGGNATITLEIVTDPPDPSVPLGDEGYELLVDSTGIRVRAHGDAGLFYGVQTLLQRLEDGDTIGCGRILDTPRFPWRGVHLDVCRHFFPVSFVKRLIDLAALHKLNTFHFHLTEDQGWRLEIPEYPRLTEISAWRRQPDGSRHGGFYSAADIAEIVDHAHRKFVTVVPEIEMPGHSVAALAAHPDLSCTGGPFEVENRWGIFDDVYCAGNDATLHFLESVLDEVVRLFPGSLVHVGGDECPKTRWRDCPRCQDRIRRESLAGENELQGWFIRRMARFLESRQRRTVGWDEILEGGLPPSAIVMCWRDPELAVEAIRRGHDVVMTPIQHCYLDYQQRDAVDEPGAIGITPLETVCGFEPVPSGLPPEAEIHVLGTQGNIWTERMPTEERVEFMAFPRLCALAEAAWSPGAGRDPAELRHRIAHHLPRLDARGVRYRPLDSAPGV